MEESYVVVEFKDGERYYGTGCWTLLKKADDFYFYTWFESGHLISNLAFQLDDFEKQKYLSEGKKFLEILSDRVDKNYPIDYWQKRLSNEEADIMDKVTVEYFKDR